MIADPQDTVTFSSLIAHLEEGAFDRDLSTAFRDMIARMSKQHRLNGGRPNAKIILAVDFTLIDGIVQTAQSFDIKPQAVRPPDRFFPGPDGSLSQRSPFIQPALDIPTKDHR